MAMRSSRRVAFFDLDDTLCDFEQAKHSALTLALGELPTADVVSSFRQVYAEIEPDLFLQAFRHHAITVAEYRLRRFAEPLRSIGIDDVELAATMDAIYRDAANSGVVLFGDARPALQAARSMGMAIVLVTNGPSDGQRTKISALGIESSFDMIRISDETGLPKPDPQAWLAPLASLSLDAGNAVMVGDSIPFDVDGAVTAGLYPILLDRSRRHPMHAGPKADNLIDAVEMIRSWAGGS
jgi:HAD superfamily hydrolase (TIGR01549 family)